MRGRQYATGAVVLVVGLVALAVGAGLAPRHLARVGLDRAAGVGILCLFVGALAAALGTYRLLTSTRRRWWPVTGVVVLVATYLSLWTLGQAVAASFPPHPAAGDRTPADLGMTYREVRLDSSDGVRLAAWYVPSRNGAALVLMHGAGSTRASVLRQAAVLAGHGYGVLLLDARGHGDSEGRGMDFGWYGEQDAEGAVDFLLRQPEVDPLRVGLVGLSMGGEQALGAAGADPRVAAVVAEGATARVAADHAYLDVYGVRGEVQQGIDRLTFGLADLLSAAPRPEPLARSVASAAGRPDGTRFLLVTAGTEPDEGHAAERLERAGGAAVRTWDVPGAGHTGGLRTMPDRWEATVVTFLDESLGARH